MCDSQCSVINATCIVRYKTFSKAYLDTLLIVLGRTFNNKRGRMCKYRR